MLKMSDEVIRCLATGSVRGSNDIRTPQDRLEEGDTSPCLGRVISKSWGERHLGGRDSTDGCIQVAMSQSIVQIVA